MSTTPTDLSDSPASADVAEAVLAVDGVHRLGSRAERTVAGVRAAAGSTGGPVPGVRVSDSPAGLQVDVAIVLSYPFRVADVERGVRRAVERSLRPAHPSAAIRTDLAVVDVRGPFDREPEAEPAPAASDPEVPAATTEGDQP